MGSLGDCTWILGLAEYRVTGLDRQEDGRLVIELERHCVRRYVCSGCSRRTGRVRDAKVRTWDDLPWAEHPVTLRYPLRRLWCRQCGIRTERVGFADPHARLPRRFRQRIGLDCQSMPTSHAALRHAVSWGTARRANCPCGPPKQGLRSQREPNHLIGEVTGSEGFTKKIKGSREAEFRLASRVTLGRTDEPVAEIVQDREPAPQTQ